MHQPNGKERKIAELEWNKHIERQKILFQHSVFGFCQDQVMENAHGGGLARPPPGRKPVYYARMIICTFYIVYYVTYRGWRFRNEC